MPVACEKAQVNNSKVKVEGIDTRRNEQGNHTPVIDDG